MKHAVYNSSRQRPRPISRDKRRGGFIVLGLFCLILGLSFVGFTVDLGMINVTKARMQSTADSAALASAQEIQLSVIAAGEQGGDRWDAAAANLAATQAASQLASTIASENNLYVDPVRDIRFGQRTYLGNGQYHIAWGASPYNAVEVTVQKTNDDSTAPDAKLDLFFSPIYGDRTTSISTKAAAYIESRDIVAVLDYSGSMTFDSQLSSSTKNAFGASAVLNNLDDIWDALSDSNVEYSNDAGTLKFPADGYGKIDSASGTFYSGSSVDEVYDYLELSGSNEGGEPYYTGWDTFINGFYYQFYNGTWYAANAASGQIWRRTSRGWRTTSSFPGPTDDIGGSTSAYVPWPQEGKDSSGMLNGKPDESTSEDHWKDYISWVRSDSDVNSFGRRNYYGYQTLMAYIIEKRKENDQSEDLWRAPVYPVNAMKEGMTQLTSFLTGLQFGDTLGLVSYATTSRVETGLFEDGADAMVDLGEYHLTTNYADINTIQLHKQGGHYDQSTNMGEGMKDGRELLETQGRDGAVPTMIVMTDGNTNRSPDDFSLPANWNWADYTDMDNDGSADYTTNDRDKQYAFYQAKLAVDQGFTIHAMSVGNGADKDLMEAIAFVGNGSWIDVSPGGSIESLRTELVAAFSTLAGDVPQAKLAQTE